MNRTGAIDLRTRQGAPRDELVFNVVMNFGIPFHAHATRSFGYPMGNRVCFRIDRQEVLHYARQILKIAPELIDRGSRFVNRNRSAAAHSQLVRDAYTATLVDTTGPNTQRLI